MRRSAAPSQKGPAPKKAHFVPPFLTTTKTDNDISAQSVTRENTVSPHVPVGKLAVSADQTRSTRDILHLIQSRAADESTVAVSTASTCSVGNLSTGTETAVSNGLRQFQKRPQLFEAIMMLPAFTETLNGDVRDDSASAETEQSMTDCDTAATSMGTGAGGEPVERYFSVMWCKVSKKKHKRWEGDAILNTKGRTVVLMDMEGKEIGHGSGYKQSEIQSLSEGQMLVIGGKQIEVMGTLSEDQYKSGSCFQSSAASHVEELSSVANSRPVSASKPFVKPFKAGNIASLPRLVTKTELSVKSMCDANSPNALVMPRPPDSHQWQHNVAGLPVVDVVVDNHLSLHLRPHQRDGVVFLYQCVMAMQPYRGCGAILADEMGLGKTLQCIALIWTLYKQGPYGGRPVIRRSLIITPGSLVKNWCKEFRKWLSVEHLSVYAVSPNNTVEQYAKSPTYPVMIISYEMFLRNVDVIKKLNFDLLVCDEGHRLKNTNVKTSLLTNSLSVTRRVVLTGTPVQNDLQELFALSDFCNPGILGTLTAFRRVYEDPILTSRQPTASYEERMLGQNRARELNRITSLFILRRTQDVNNKYLPPRVDMVLFCALTELQLQLYRAILRSRAVTSCLHSSDSSHHLRCISALKKLCNHAQLLRAASAETSAESDDPEADLYRGISALFPDDYESHSVLVHSGKMQVLASLLSTVYAAQHEKVVIVSSYTSTLDLIESMCKSAGYLMLRLDGQTPTARRMELVERFNCRSSPEFVMLLSTKAGGVGLNLVGASRLVLYDIDWNPANDLQAMARVWRDGQQRHTYVYRLLTAGSIEEKIFQRQVNKQALTGAVVDAKASDNQVPAFDAQQLRRLFRLNETTLCETHDLLDCHCITDNSSPKSSCLPRENVRDCQLNILGAPHSTAKNTGMDELLEWKHIAGPSPDLSAVDPLMATSSLPQVTFAMWTENNSLAVT